MIKKKTLKKNQKLLKYFFKKTELITLLLKSFRRNEYIDYIDRISYFMVHKTRRELYFKSQQKLICLFDLSKKVPNRHFKYSRFFLNRRLNYLTIANTYK